MMKKKLVSLFLALAMSLSLAVPAMAAGEKTEDTPDLNDYIQFPVPFSVTYSGEHVTTIEEKQGRIEYAKEYVRSLDLGRQGAKFIEEACLTELDALAQNPDYRLDAYTVLVPRVIVPGYYGTYGGMEFYQATTSVKNATLEKRYFGAGEELAEWAMSAVDIILLFDGSGVLSIPFTIMNAVLPSKYEVHTDDFMDAYMKLDNIYNRAVYAKDGSAYKLLVNSEFGQVQPYFIYHYVQSSSVVPAEIVYGTKKSYPAPIKNDVLYLEKYIYDVGGNPLTFLLKDHVDLLWE